MNLLDHRREKFPVVSVVASSAAPGWKGIAAEIRAHPASELPPVKATHAEVRYGAFTTGASQAPDEWLAMHNATIESWQPVDSEIPAPDTGGLVSGTHPQRRLADDVVSTLRSLDLVAKLWDEAHEAGEHSAPCELIVADSTSLRLIAACKGGPRSDGIGAVDQAGPGGLAPGVLRRVVEHIEANLGERIDIRELATFAGLSECHFSRAFRQSFGMPPHRYVVSRRVAVGAALIERTERSMTDVALSIGFSDHSHFTRTFGRVTGETPSAYRRSRRPAIETPG